MFQREVFIILLFLGLYFFTILFRLLLDAINLRHIRRAGSNIPEQFKNHLVSGDIERANKYAISKTYFSILQFLFDKILILLFLFSGLLGWYASLFYKMGFATGGFLFFAGLFIASYILGVPFTYYDKFISEQKYGFNTSTLKTWALDIVKSILLGGIFSGLLLLGVLILIKFFPLFWWAIAWLAAFLFSLFLIFIYPLVIAPLFNKFTPIEGELADALIGIATKAGLKVKGVFQMDASKRSRHTNAYFTGLGRSKRIVLYDTLVNTHPKEEIVAILAHEIGHWKMKHVIKHFLITQIITLAAFFLTAMIIREPDIYNIFAVSSRQLYVGLLVVMVLFEIPSFFLLPLTNFFSRRFEREADRYAVTLVGSSQNLVNSLKRLVKDNLSNLNPHPIYASFFYSHPPVLERLKYLV